MRKYEKKATTDSANQRYAKKGTLLALVLALTAGVGCDGIYTPVYDTRGRLHTFGSTQRAEPEGEPTTGYTRQNAEYFCTSRRADTQFATYFFPNLEIKVDLDSEQTVLDILNDVNAQAKNLDNEEAKRILRILGSKYQSESDRLTHEITSEDLITVGADDQLSDAYRQLIDNLVNLIKTSRGDVSIYDPKKDWRRQAYERRQNPGQNVYVQRIPNKPRGRI